MFEQGVEFVAGEWLAFGGALHFDHAAVARHHHVHVGVAVRVLGIIEIKHRHAFKNADRDRGDRIADRRSGEQFFLQQITDCIVQCHIGAGNAGGARAAVGLNDVAIDLDGAFAQRLHVDHRAQCAADQALDFLRAARLFAARGFAVHARVGRTRQHAVFGGDPALPPAFEKARHFFLDARSAQHLGIAAFDEHRSLGVSGVTARDADGAQLVRLAIAWPHKCAIFPVLKIGGSAIIRPLLRRSDGRLARRAYSTSHPTDCH